MVCIEKVLPGIIGGVEVVVVEGGKEITGGGRGGREGKRSIFKTFVKEMEEVGKEESQGCRKLETGKNIYTKILR